MSRTSTANDVWARCSALRFMGEKLTTDLAIFNVSGSNIVGVPYVDFVFKF